MKFPLDVGDMILSFLDMRDILMYRLVDRRVHLVNYSNVHDIYMTFSMGNSSIVRSKKVDAVDKAHLDRQVSIYSSDPCRKDFDLVLDKESKVTINIVGGNILLKVIVLCPPNVCMKVGGGTICALTSTGKIMIEELFLSSHCILYSPTLRSTIMFKKGNIQSNSTVDHLIFEDLELNGLPRSIDVIVTKKITSTLVLNVAVGSDIYNDKFVYRRSIGGSMRLVRRMDKLILSPIDVHEYVWKY